MAQPQTMFGRPLRAREKQRLFVAAMAAAALLACFTVAYPAIVRPDPKLTRARKHMRVVVRWLDPARVRHGRPCVC